jgi:signal transduction histidine kinase
MKETPSEPRITATKHDPVVTDALKLDASADLQTVLAAWHGATLRLERTHEALRAEVRRLTDELHQKNRELARKNRLADLGQMAAHVAHEVRNTLVPVMLYLGLLRRRIAGDAASLEVLDKITAGMTALDATVHDLLHFTSDRDPQRRPFALRPLIDDLLASLAPQLSAQTISVRVEISPADWVVADREMIRRAVLNLVLNALDAMPNGGTLTVRSVRQAGSIELEVVDTGPGLSADALGRAFEPFYTTKPAGTGLGLAIVYRIAEVHGGRVAAHNHPDGGARFTLSLPVLSQEAAA